MTERPAETLVSSLARCHVPLKAPIGATYKPGI